MKLVELAIVCSLASAQDRNRERNREVRVHGDEYEALLASEKYQRLKDKIEGGEAFVAETQFENLDQLFTEQAGMSLNWVGDDMKSGDIKHLHLQGLVAPVRYVANQGTPYSGLFNTGGEYGYLRLSEAGYMFAGDSSSIPSAALKLLRDGQPSGNLLVMDAFDGQQSLDFFLNDLSTHPKVMENETCKQTVQRKNSEASKFVFSVGTNDFANWDDQGNQAIDLKFPQEVVFVPTDNIREKSAAWVENDLTPGVDGSVYFAELAADLLTMPLGFNEDGSEDNTIFTVWGREDNEKELVRIGLVEITESFVESQWADEFLFFRHENYNNDYNLMQGDQTKRQFTSWNAFENDVEVWGDTTVRPLPTDRDEASEVIQEGVNQFGCPFAWLIEEINTSTGIW